MNVRSLSPLNLLPLRSVLTHHLVFCDGERLGSVILSCVARDGSSCIQIVLTLDQCCQLTVKRLKPKPIENPAAPFRVKIASCLSAYLSLLYHSCITMNSETKRQL